MGEGTGALGSGCCPARWPGAPRGSWGQRIPPGWGGQAASNSRGRTGAGEGRGGSPWALSRYVGGLSAYTLGNMSPFHFIVFIANEQKAFRPI